MKVYHGKINEDILFNVQRPEMTCFTWHSEQAYYWLNICNRPLKRVFFLVCTIYYHLSRNSIVSVQGDGLKHLFKKSHRVYFLCGNKTDSKPFQSLFSIYILETERCEACDIEFLQAVWSTYTCRYVYKRTFLSKRHSVLTYTCLETYTRGIGTQCSPRSDAINVCL